MSYLKNIKLFILLILFIFSTKSFSQFSKTHYIPPVASTGNGPADPLDQYLYVSTPNEIPFNVTITPIGGTSTTFSISNSSPYEYSIGNNANTNLIALTANAVDKFTDKGFIVEDYCIKASGEKSLLTGGFKFNSYVTTKDKLTEFIQNILF